MSGKFTVFTGKSGQTYFNLKAGNGEVILKSQGYRDKASAHNGIESVRKNSPDGARYEKRTSASGKLHLHLKAANQQVLGSSEMYRSERSRDAGIASVMANAPDARLGEERAFRHDPAGSCRNAVDPSQRISVDLPNSDSTRSTASLAVWLRLSKAGFSSTMSSDATRPVSASISMHNCASR